MEIFNFVNNATIYTRNETWGAQWFNPISLVEARRFQFWAQLDFQDSRQSPHDRQERVLDLERLELADATL